MKETFVMSIGQPSRPLRGRRDTRGGLPDEDGDADLVAERIMNPNVRPDVAAVDVAGEVVKSVARTLRRLKLLRHRSSDYREFLGVVSDAHPFSDAVYWTVLPLIERARDLSLPMVSTTTPPAIKPAKTVHQIIAEMKTELVSLLIRRDRP
jgi:hypothetical protein